VQKCLSFIARRKWENLKNVTSGLSCPPHSGTRAAEFSVAVGHAETDLQPEWLGQFVEIPEAQGLNPQIS
jgi:hypothetical protein